jgi:hypothetical protein
VAKPNFNKLKATWDKKLKAFGFVDIEDTTFNNPQSYTFKDPLMFKVTQEYFYLAGHFLNDYEFESEIDRIIWEYHSNGLSVREISATLKKVKIKLSKSAVGNKIKKLADIMKDKYLE